MPAAWRRAGRLVEAVDVLGDDRHAGEPGPLGEGAMPGVGLGRRHQAAAPVVPLPDPLWIIREGLRRCQLGGIEAGPETGLGVAEGRHAALRGDPGTGQGHHPARRTQTWGQIVRQVDHGHSEYLLITYLPQPCRRDLVGAMTAVPGASRGGSPPGHAVNPSRGKR